jgi:hypothetical protein
LADFAGLLSVAILILVAAIIWPIPGWLLLGSCPIFFLLNGLVWHVLPSSEMKPSAAVRSFLGVAALLAVIAVIYVGFGFIDGQRTIPGAFFRGAPFGGFRLSVLVAIGVFVGIPTLVRSVALFYERRRT